MMARNRRPLFSDAAAIPRCGQGSSGRRFMAAALQRYRE